MCITVITRCTAVVRPVDNLRTAERIGGILRKILMRIPHAWQGCRRAGPYLVNAPQRDDRVRPVSGVPSVCETRVKPVRGTRGVCRALVRGFLCPRWA